MTTRIRAILPGLLVTLVTAACADPSADPSADGDVAPDADAADAALDGDPGEGVVAGCGDRVDGTPCDDGNVCTVDDACSSGVCVGGTSLDCGFKACHETGCDPVSGCFDVQNDGVGCALGCFADATCVAGACVPDPASKQPCAPPTAAELEADPCLLRWECSSGSGECDHPIFKLPGEECDIDQDYCSIDRCDERGSCVDANEVRDCGPGGNNPAYDPCYTYVCAIKGCQRRFFVPGNSCNDNNPCTVTDRCVAAGDGLPERCAGTPLPVDDGNPCTEDGCELSGTAVFHRPLPEGVACIPGDPCSEAGACDSAGHCVPSEACECYADADCATDACTVGRSCVDHACTAGTPRVCDDGDVCNGAETCDGASGCVAGTPLECAVAGECVNAGCDAVDGCTASDAADGEGCEDGDVCTVGDTCSGAQCVPGAACGEVGGVCTPTGCAVITRLVALRTVAAARRPAPQDDGGWLLLTPTVGTPPAAASTALRVRFGVLIARPTFPSSSP
ncbi:MAG: hypothetical protein CVU56_29195 [Deltaproteobacteria bacterium HGW-Deltaproteobacteria-14]|nr:MAG: hypothetical protein CVU56_29195 [Deltaproteobacteria bacterium HGW-Deltaproteobacteria-14]